MPFQESHFSESGFLRENFSGDSLVYEEACLQPSDARFVLNWILGYQNEFHVPINYCAVQNCAFDSSKRVWKLEIKNELTAQEVCAEAKLVINAAGVWTDELNRKVGMETPYQHVFGKGVFLAFERFPGHELPLIMDAGEHTQSLCLIPWGPVSLWGPTETRLDSLNSAFRVDPEDVRFLLKRLNHHLKKSVDASHIVSLRCGVRPLAVDRSYSGTGRTLEISRRHRLFADAQRPWISLYGGKITSCIGLAEETFRELETRIAPSGRKIQPESPTDEMCCTLEDHLRRRTNISQWKPRGGFGFKNEFRSDLFSIAMQIHQDPDRATQDFLSYEAKIKSEFDDVIKEVV
jgi:glycerol-3-phosphate dehydrogenase